MILNKDIIHAIEAQQTCLITNSKTIARGFMEHIKQRGKQIEVNSEIRGQTDKQRVPEQEIQEVMTGTSLPHFLFMSRKWV